MRIGLTILVIGFLASCAHTPARYHVEEYVKYEHVGSLPVEENDSLEVSVPVGTLRNALYVAEAYEALIPVVNERGEIMFTQSQLIAEQASEIVYLKDALVIGVGLGVFTGFTIAAGVMLWLK